MHFSACDTTLFPANPGPNSLDANVPAVLPVGVAIAYMCTDATYTLLGNPSNQCDDQGFYTAPPVCTIGKLQLLLWLCRTRVHELSKEGVSNSASIYF